MTSSRRRSSSPCNVIMRDARRLRIGRDLRHDRFSERSYLFTMSDITPAHQASRPDGAGERRSLRTSSRLGWWSQTESNRRPPACKAGALPTELWPLQITEASIREERARLITDT